ncbi:hypothetical protein M9H77_13620 [Catharanthus roseus]|uniref:Uncharacterized protein n=1 Tax=Catharanthus roseus TaxID=4058 RepID=A0ACC0BKY2_CATRO|nr:hypothetical protein M9H77_13620 [Catharanthus roseus]
MVRPSGRRGDDDLGPVMDRTGESGSFIQPPAIPFRSRPPLQPHLPHTPVPYEPYGSVQPSSQPTDTVYDPYLHASTIRPRILYRSATQEPILEFIGQPRQIGAEFFYQMFGAAPQDSSCSTHEYSHAEYDVSSSVPYGPRLADRVCEGDIGFEGNRGVGEEQERVGSLHIEGEADERGDDDGDGGDDDQDEGDDAGDKEQPVHVAPVAHSSRLDGRPRHGKRKGLTGSFMLVMSKIAGSRNKRPKVAREIPTPTQKRKKVKPSDWEQTGPAEGGPVDPEFIPSYAGNVAGPIWRGQVHFFMLKLHVIIIIIIL